VNAAIARHAVVRPCRHSAIGELAGLVASASPAHLPAKHSAKGNAVGQNAENLCIRWVRLDGLAQQRLGANVLGLGLPEIGRQRAQVEVVGGQTFSGFGSRALDLGSLDVLFHGGNDPLRNLVLQGEDGSEVALVAIGPNVGAGLGLDQLGDDAHPGAGLAYAALSHVAHAKLAADLQHIGDPDLVDEARLAGDHEQPAHARQGHENVVDHAVGEVLLLRIAAHVGKRQHGDRWPVGQG
jgi:hypothetical protein